MCAFSKSKVHLRGLNLSLDIFLIAWWSLIYASSVFDWRRAKNTGKKYSYVSLKAMHTINCAASTLIKLNPLNILQIFFFKKKYSPGGNAIKSPVYEKV